MFEQKSICPYTGLRSFNEEESLYFEGREKQITEITRLLEKNHFLMVTGASGDGKSSVVYAGIIPNARAGFFKARFPNWVVADFRPEKSPLKNFSSSIAEALHIPNAGSAETEIKRGFSSLIDLYKNSPHFIDENDPEWIQADEFQRKEKINKGANLMILVDQFEEFFTAQENFSNGVPSQESQITLNVILETARIALKENIPIYVICTMRSDYIGQCASFRGLPEYIGFSQFFVPRLKRNQLKKVIAEPAKLSGNSISTRLVERLIYDLNEGIDQLPILQHALSQIWRMADKENEEMDLIHYAMVGGMPANELPDEDKDRFLKWYKGLPEYQRKSYKTASLENVLDIHANRLYESAASEYNNKYPEEPIPIGDAKKAIALTFACLSSIDEGRGVRNRMTLQEITNIINNPALDYVKVGRLLNILRIEGNTFLRPFISTEEDNIDLDPDNVLDITHESLIRNWKRLKKWAQKESEYYETFLDFKKQLNRWTDNNKSSNYLLPVGPLGFFENWYKECNPNAHWINRYQDNIEDKNERLKYSSNILEQSKSFLKKSANKHFLAKLFMTYGARNIAIGVAVLSTLILSSFYYTDAVQKQNDNVIKKIYTIAEDHINNDALLLDFNDSKATWLRSALVRDPASAISILQNIQPSKVKIEVPIKTYEELLKFAPSFADFEKDSIISTIRKNIDEVFSGNAISQGEKLTNINNFISLLSHDLVFSPTDNLEPAISEATEIAYNLLLDLLKKEASEQADISYSIFKGIQHINNFSDQSSSKLKEIIPFISPFQESGKANFEKYFPSSSFLPNGGDRLSHNGGYQLMAEIYASLGDEKNMYLSLEKLLESNDVLKYSNQESFNSIYQIFGYLLEEGHEELFEDFINYVQTTFNIEKIKFCEWFIDRSGHYKSFNSTNIIGEYQNHPGKLNPILTHLSPELMATFFDFADGIIRTYNNPDIQNFYTALFLKYKALITNKYYLDKNESIPISEIDQWLIKAYESYGKVSASYLETEVQLTYKYFGDGIRRKMMSNKNRFLYPDVFTSSYQGNTYLSGYYADFLVRNPSYTAYYNSIEQQDLIIDWLYRCHEYFFGFGDVRRIEIKLSLDQLISIHDFFSSSEHAANLDLNLLNLLICNQNFKLGNNSLANEYYRNLEIDKINASAGRLDYLNATFVYNQVVELASNLAKEGKKDQVKSLIDQITQNHFKVASNLNIARNVHESEYPEHTYHYIQEAYKGIDEIGASAANLAFHYNRKIIETLSGIGSRELDLLVDEEMKKIYPGGTTGRNLGLISRGKYYQAFVSIPKANTITEDLNDYEAFLLIDSKNLNHPKWAEYKERLDRYGLSRNNYIRFVSN